MSGAGHSDRAWLHGHRHRPLSTRERGGDHRGGPRAPRALPLQPVEPGALRLQQDQDAARQVTAPIGHARRCVKGLQQKRTLSRLHSHVQVMPASWSRPLATTPSPPSSTTRPTSLSAPRAATCTPRPFMPNFTVCSGGEGSSSTSLEVRISAYRL